MRERIMMAAAQEMNERGVKFTVDAVASRLGISKKTLYQYYESKDALIRTMVDAALADMDAQEQAILAGDASFKEKLMSILTVVPQNFGQINDWVVDDLKRFRPEEWDRIEQHMETKQSGLEELLQMGMDSGQLRPLNKAFVAKLLLVSCKELFNYSFLTRAKLTIVDALRIYADVVLNGIVAERDLEEDQDE